MHQATTAGAGTAFPGLLPGDYANHATSLGVVGVAYPREVRVAEPVHNVELRRDHHGHESVVFAFPYRAEVVDAVRGIPGRRFDWEAKEWWALQADATAPFVKGVLEHHAWLSVAPEVHAWLATSATGWAGRVSAGRLDGAGRFVLEAISGELPEPLATMAEVRGGRLWLPFTAEVAEALVELRGARMDQRALRCAHRLQVGTPPAPATLSLIESVGEPRFRLEVNWDPDTIPAFLALPACEAHGRSVPVDPYLLEPLEHYLRTFGVEVAPAAADVLTGLRAEHDAAIEDVRRSRAHSGPSLAIEGVLGGELRPFQRGGVAYVLDARRTFLADEQGLGKTVQALAALEADDAFPAVVVCPASLKLNWQREIEHWLPHRSVTVISGTGGTAPAADIAVLNYEIVHAHRTRLALRRPRALVLDESHYVKNPRAKRTRAVRRLAEALPEDALRLALTGTPVMNHPDELIAQLRILGRLEEFGSGARFARRFQGPGAEQRIHWHLRRRCFVRRLKADVLPQLPAKRQVVVPVALENEREYRLAEQDVIAWLREQPLDLSELEARVAAALRAERLAQLNALKRLAARGKAGPALAWIGDFLASDEPLVVFAGHREVQNLLLVRFPDAVHLLGRDSVAAREAAVRAFQAPDGPQLIVCSTRVGAQGITLTRASNVAFLDLEWTPAIHDQAEDRCHRIGQDDAVTAWYLLAAETIDETMIELIARKRGIVGAVTDGRLDESEALVQAVVRELRGTAPRRRLRPVA
jgi:SWI/SNF-related matrix-associated actin-dependent regulator of chromatin subfamily A-like protein 1